MKNSKIFFIGLSLIILFLSCKKEEPIVSSTKSYNLIGKVQKGPFATGSDINVYELDENLSQTGKSFLTTIDANDGSFSLDNVELTSNFLLVNANGFYFDEIGGGITYSRISLQSIVDLSDNSTVNINLFTHVSVKRIRKLVEEGQTLQSALNQSKVELLTFFGVSESFQDNFDDYDISQNDDYNGVLLAFSVMCQRLYSSPADLSQFLTYFSNDFSDNGIINSQSIIDTLLYSTSLLNIVDIKENIENKYISLGIDANIPDFKQYINNFILEYDDTIYTDIIYPNTAIDDLWSPDYSFVRTNILNNSDTVFNLHYSYCVAAIVPIGNSLTIKIKDDMPGGGRFNAGDGGNSSGWRVERNLYSIGHEYYTNQRENSLLSIEFGFYVPGSATIEFYENGDETPTFTKHIHFQ